MEVFQRAVAIFVGIMSACAIIVTIFYTQDVIDKIKKRK